MPGRNRHRPKVRKALPPRYKNLHDFYAAVAGSADVARLQITAADTSRVLATALDLLGRLPTHEAMGILAQGTSPVVNDRHVAQVVFSPRPAAAKITDGRGNGFSRDTARRSRR